MSRLIKYFKIGNTVMKRECIVVCRSCWVDCIGQQRQVSSTVELVAGSDRCNSEAAQFCWRAWSSESRRVW